MYPSIFLKALCLNLVFVLVVSVAGSTFAADLTVAEAEQLALKNDDMLRSFSARSASMTELAVVSEKLPDPQLKLGFANLPTDTFNLGQEPMTQAVIGVRQQFPRGHTRSLNSARVLESQGRIDAETLDYQHKIKLAVRESFTQIYLQQQRQVILEQSLVVFADLAQITEDYYSTGRSHQHDVVQAQLELSRFQERLSRVQQQEAEARARLSERLGADAYRPFVTDWPNPGQPAAREQIIAGLEKHPRMIAWQHEISKAKTSEEIARQAYKPGFAVDLAYGGRGGNNPDGTDRTDFVSVFVTMDIPLFTKNRQDRVLASSISETSATEFARDDIYRSMKASVEQNFATLEREQQRLELYENTLLQQAEFNAEAAFEAYQDAVGDLTTLMRARIGEFELKLDHVALQADEILTRSRLLYLQGESS